MDEPGWPNYCVLHNNPKSMSSPFIYVCMYASFIIAIILLHVQKGLWTVSIIILFIAIIVISLYCCRQWFWRWQYSRRAWPPNWTWIIKRLFYWLWKIEIKRKWYDMIWLLLLCRYITLWKCLTSFSTECRTAIIFNDFRLTTSDKNI